MTGRDPRAGKTRDYRRASHGKTPGRCRSYRRSSGVFIYSRVRCELYTGHNGQHYAAGRFLNPHGAHKWGRP